MPLPENNILFYWTAPERAFLFEKKQELSHIDMYPVF